ncbi:hypothetical protein [Marinibacterium sp. SX1]|uniref:hypothetical protein n=1 Tax=Marinibacterium sp. SX1 TaxID=3388424 RepID=UPI003D185D3B
MTDTESRAPRRLILHCGPSKTGTSAIQDQLRNLSQPGLIYPQTGQWPDGAHHLLAWAQAGRSRRGPVDIPPFADQLQALARELGAWSGDLLISSEAILAGQAAGFADALRAGLPGGFDRVELIVTLRHPLERAASAYNQSVKDPVEGETRDPDDYLAKAGGHVLLSPLVRQWSALGLPVHFLGYHPSATLVQRFFDLIGHPAPAMETQTRNASMNGYGLLIYLLANRLKLDGPERDRLREAIRADRARRPWQGESFPFSAAAVAAYRERVEQDRAQLVRDTGLDMDWGGRDKARFRITADDARAILDHLASAAPDKVDRDALAPMLADFIETPDQPANAVAPRRKGPGKGNGMGNGPEQRPGQGKRPGRARATQG